MKEKVLSIKERQTGNQDLENYLYEAIKDEIPSPKLLPNPTGRSDREVAIGVSLIAFNKINRKKDSTT